MVTLDLLLPTCPNRRHCFGQDPTDCSIDFTHLLGILMSHIKSITRAVLVRVYPSPEIRRGRRDHEDSSQ